MIWGKILHAHSKEDNLYYLPSNFNDFKKLQETKSKNSFEKIERVRLYQPVNNKIEPRFPPLI